MDTPAIQRLIDRAHVANNEPARIDAKKAQTEIDALRAQLQNAPGTLFVEELILAADRARIAADMRAEAERSFAEYDSAGARGLLARLLRVVEGK
jgi:hypothetical protein